MGTPNIGDAGISPPVPPVSRSDKAERHKRLCDLIQAAVQTEGQEEDGQVWAMMPLADWAAKLDVSSKTIARLIRERPIQRLDTGKWKVAEQSPDFGPKGVFAELVGRGRRKGRWVRVVALRVGADAPQPSKGHRQLAGKMAKLFFEKTGRTVDRDSYGCLIGLAELWPEGHQLPIFQGCLNDWSDFMAGVKLRDDAGQHRFLDYPLITLMRLWPHVAADCHLARLQEAGGAATPPYPYHYL